MRIGDLKKCGSCKRELARACFSKNHQRADGLQSHCKECDKEYQRARKKPSYNVRPRSLVKYADHEHVMVYGARVRKLSEAEIQTFADHVACERTARYMSIKRMKPIRLEAA
jgi:ribosomal protein S15P/S13E